MNFKTKIFAVILIASDVVIAGCGSNSSRTEYDWKILIKPIVSDSTILKSSLHNNAKSLHSLPSTIIGFAGGI